MTIKTVLLHAASETLDPDRSAGAYALGLAGAFEAHLEALVLELDVITPKGAYGHNIAAEERSRIRSRNEEVGVAAEALRMAAQKQGVKACVITDRSHVHSTPEIATDHARLADIAVAGVCDEGLLSERMVAEALIFQSGRPVIIIPRRAHRYSLGFQQGRRPRAIRCAAASSARFRGDPRLLRRRQGFRLEPVARRRDRRASPPGRRGDFSADGTG